jgi:glucan phosphoethanolaminetransferase (alkaline phosphatase superfamily)
MIFLLLPATDNGVNICTNKISELISLLHELKLGRNLFIIGAVYFFILFLNRRKRIAANTALLIGIVWHFFYEPVTQFITSLGVDSFSEAKTDFSLAEAGFWLSTLGHALTPKPDVPTLLLTLALSVISFYCLRWILNRHEIGRRYYFLITSSIATLLIVYSVQKIIFDSIIMFIDNSESYATTIRNFDNKPPSFKKESSKVNLIIYIGESTTTMNMGLYGYPRNTTPNLSRLSKDDRNFIQFYNVFSTHTHTSPSLLEAFSLPVDRSDDFLPINRRKRVPIVDMLNKAGVCSRLISNQGMSGTWNQASTIIFRNAEKTFSVDSHRYGNSEDLVKKPMDDEFFEKQIVVDKVNKINSGSSVTFLHSYAGHGAYLDFIPESYRHPVDNYLSINGFNILTKSNIMKDIEDYDSAIKYIDYSISKTIDYVKRSNKATIFIYFSDHGESVFTGRGHDSSRFIHEMARVPFLMYFNDAAIKENPDLFNKYVRLSKSRETATLAQLPSVILDLCKITIIPSAQNSAYSKPLIGERCSYCSPIVVREVSAGITYVNLNREKPLITNSHGYRITEMSDAATLEFVASRNDINKFHEHGRKSETSLEEACRKRLIYSFPDQGYTGK